MRESIISSVSSLLAGVCKVKRDTNTDLLSARDMPCVIIQDNGQEQINYKTAGFADVYITLGLEMRVASAKNQSTALNALDSSIKTALATNPTLSGTVAHVTIQPQSGGDTQGADDVAIRTRNIIVFYEASTASGL